MEFFRRNNVFFLGTLLLGILVAINATGVVRIGTYLPGDFDLWMAGWIGVLLVVSAESKRWKNFTSIWKWLLGISLMGFVFAIMIDGLRYQGYLFDKIGIEPASLVWLIAFSSMLGLVEFLRSKNLNLLQVVIVMLLFYLVAGNLYTSSWILGRRLQFNVGQDMRSDDAKMRAVWDEFYDYTLFLREQVSENEVLLHPPQENPWQRIGNQLVLRYFVYPMKLLQADNTNFREQLRMSDWVVISDGTPTVYPSDGLYGWPQLPVPIDMVALFDPKEILVDIDEITVTYLDGRKEIVTLDEKSYSMSGELDNTMLPLGIDSSDIMTIRILGKSTRDYSISIVAVGEQQGSIIESEGPSNIGGLLWNETDDQQSFELDSDIALLNARLQAMDVAQADVFIKLTNRLPLPYLYGKGLVKVAHEDLLLDQVTSERLLLAGDTAWMNEEWEKAEAYYQQALWLNDNEVGALLGMYYVLVEKGNMQSANDYLDRAEKLLPEEKHLNLATILKNI